MMQHTTKSLYWTDCNQSQVRNVLLRNAISGSLWTEASKRFNDPAWDGGPHLYLIDTLTDRGARVTNQGAGTYDVKISSRTGEDLLSELTETFPALLDKLVIID
jgi:hypothetical protein